MFVQNKKMVVMQAYPHPIMCKSGVLSSVVEMTGTHISNIIKKTKKKKHSAIMIVGVD